MREAKKQGADIVILDTAGRLHIDDELMQQLERIDRQVVPQQVYLVVDSMTGQDAVNSAKVFNDKLELDGVIMTKLDGDARGGAALSVKQVTGVPIKFIGTGEHLDALEEFHPDRMAGRILGQGDLLSLVEKAQQEFDQDEMLRQEERLKKGEFTLDDFRKQLSQIGKLGPLQKVMGMIPGMGGMAEKMGDLDPETDMKRLFGIIDSMTPAERRTPSKIIDQPRRRRIAAGAGVQPHEVNDLVKQFNAMAQMMTSLAGKGMRERMKMMQGTAVGHDAEPERPGQAKRQHGQTPHTQGAGQTQEGARKGNAQTQTRPTPRRRIRRQRRSLNGGQSMKQFILLAIAIVLSACVIARAQFAPQQLIESKKDILGDAALKQPGGPSFEFFADKLPPLAYVERGTSITRSCWPRRGHS